MENNNTLLLNKIKDIKAEYDELDCLVSSVEIMTDNKLFLFYKKKKDRLEKIVNIYNSYEKNVTSIKENQEFLNIETDENIKNDLILENNKLNDNIKNQLLELKIELLNFEKIINQSVQIEICFKYGQNDYISYILDIINNYAKINDIQINITNKKTDSVLINANGYNAYNDLKVLNGIIKIIFENKETYFSIVVLNTDSNIINFKEEDVAIETLKSSGAGGQHINKTESAIRLTHKPTGISVICQDERSQNMNKNRAFENLREKIQKINKQNFNNNLEMQRKKNNNDIFGTTPSIVLNLDKNVVYYNKAKTEYKLKNILDGEIKLISGDLIING